MILRKKHLSWLLLTSLPIVGYAIQQPLKLRLVQGATASYKVAMEESRFQGSNPVAAEKISNQTPIRLQVQSVNGRIASVEVTKGPMIMRGRSVGRAKTSVQTIDLGGQANGQVPANFFVCLPKGGAKVGQTWRASFFGGPPLPAGIPAVYRFTGVSKDGRFASVDMQVSSAGASQLKGSGKLFLRLSDGILDHGTATFNIIYLRPDQNNRDKIMVNSKVVLKYTITAG